MSLLFNNAVRASSFNDGMVRWVNGQPSPLRNQSNDKVMPVVWLGETNSTSVRLAGDWRTGGYEYIIALGPEIEDIYGQRLGPCEPLGVPGGPLRISRGL